MDYKNNEFDGSPRPSFNSTKGKCQVSTETDAQTWLQQSKTIDAWYCLSKT